MPLETLVKMSAGIRQCFVDRPTKALSEVAETKGKPLSAIELASAKLVKWASSSMLVPQREAPGSFYYKKFDFKLR